MKLAAITLGIFALASCAHETRARKDVAEEPIVHAPMAVPPSTDEAADAEAPNESLPIIFAETKRVLVANPPPKGWQVSYAEAQLANAGAADAIRIQHPEVFSKLDTYVAQIFGVSNQGHRSIELNFMCNETLVPPPDDMDSGIPLDVQHELASMMTSGPVRCRDGGDCCFQLYFDPSDGSYTMYVNGH